MMFSDIRSELAAERLRDLVADAERERLIEAARRRSTTDSRSFRLARRLISLARAAIEPRGIPFEVQQR